MSKELELLMEEKIYQLKNDLETKKIEAKTMAEFASVFYEKYGENYNEKLLIQICKKTMNFYNEGVKNLPDESKEYFIENILNEISKLRNNLSFLIKKDISINETSFENTNIEFIKDKYKEIVNNINHLKEKKPFFIFRRSWRKKIEKSFSELEKIYLTLRKLKEDEENSESNKIRKQNFKDLTDDLKKFLYETDNEIGVELKKIFYEDVMKEEKLEEYIYEVVIANLYKYFVRN